MAEKNGRLAGVLGDFSVSQLLATALAAATYGECVVSNN